MRSLCCSVSIVCCFCRFCLMEPNFLLWFVIFDFLPVILEKKIIFGNNLRPAMKGHFSGENLDLLLPRILLKNRFWGSWSGATPKTLSFWWAPRCRPCGGSMDHTLRSEELEEDPKAWNQALSNSVGVTSLLTHSHPGGKPLGLQLVVGRVAWKMPHGKGPGLGPLSPHKHTCFSRMPERSFNSEGSTDMFRSRTVSVLAHLTKFSSSLSL